MSRGWLAFDSAESSARSGDVARTVSQLRRLRGYLNPADDPRLACRVGERLAYYLLEINEATEADETAAAAIGVLPADPPRWERARALATYAQTRMHCGDEATALATAQQAREAARAADAPWLEADTLVTLGLLDERRGRPKEAVDQMTLAFQQASTSKLLDVHLRAAFQLARIHLERGDLADASRVAHQGLQVAGKYGLSMAPYGLDLQYTHYLAHYAEGAWDHAQEVTDGFTARVTSVAEARLSAMALFIDVARGNPNVADRVTWMRPFWAEDSFGAFIAQSLIAENALWQGDAELAAAEVAAVIGDHAEFAEKSPPIIRVAATGLAAQADLAARARAAGETEKAAAAVAAAAELIELAREGAAYPSKPLYALGVEGRGWLARAEAEWLRAQGRNDPDAWCEVIEVFGPSFVYERARSQWRLAEALAEAGQREEAQQAWRLALDVARGLAAQPLVRALHDLGRRARLDTGPVDAAAAAEGAGAAPGLLSGLTAREREVLRLLAQGSSNREIAAELFIAPKTASVHVSNILAKLGAASRTEAAAIAHRNGVGLPARG
jgi:DNA-binding CsgD family transcriptional regulator